MSAGHDYAGKKRLPSKCGKSAVFFSMVMLLIALFCDSARAEFLKYPPEDLIVAKIISPSGERTIHPFILDQDYYLLLPSYANDKNVVLESTYDISVDGKNVSAIDMHAFLQEEDHCIQFSGGDIQYSLKVNCSANIRTMY